MNLKLTRVFYFCFAMLFAALFAAPAVMAQKVLDADIVVVGAGASGTAAATQAAQLGAKVIVLEKAPAPGGTGNFAEGIFAAESSLQIRQGINVSRDFAFKTIMDYSHWRANPKLARAFVNKSSDTIEWLKAMGVEFEYIGVGGFGGPLTWHVIANGHSKEMLRIMRGELDKRGGKIFLETPAKKLIVQSGRVVGVMAENADGEKIQVNAKAVVIATGGFANNKEMMKKYSRYPDMIFVGNAGKMGEGIQMAWEVGAAEEGVGVMQSYRPGLAGMSTSSHLLGAARQPYLWVDQRGDRFTDESIIELWPYSGNAVERIGGTMYAIYDADTKKKVMEQGIDLPIGEWIIAHTKLTELDKEIEKDGGKNVFIANSVEELAKKMGANPQALKATIDDNNRFAAQRMDEQFGKSSRWLRPVAKAPFYATKMHPMALGTLGGVKVNEKLEAVAQNGDPIPGLYTVGNDAGGMYGDSYDLLLGGGTLGFAVNSGRIAAENAVAYGKTVR